jgi:hypothetical protein
MNLPYSIPPEADFTWLKYMAPNTFAVVTWIAGDVRVLAVGHDRDRVEAEGRAVDEQAVVINVRVMTSMIY